MHVAEAGGVVAAVGPGLGLPDAGSTAVRLGTSEGGGGVTGRTGVKAVEGGRGLERLQILVAAPAEAAHRSPLASGPSDDAEQATGWLGSALSARQELRSRPLNRFRLELAQSKTYRPRSTTTALSVVSTTQRQPVWAAHAGGSTNSAATGSGRAGSRRRRWASTRPCLASSGCRPLVGRLPFQERVLVSVLQRV